jgi:hypothetical protein
MRSGFAHVPVIFEIDLSGSSAPTPQLENFVAWCGNESVQSGVHRLEVCHYL